MTNERLEGSFWIYRTIYPKVLHSKSIEQTRYNNNDVCKFVQSPKLTCSKFKPQSWNFAALKQ